MFFSWDEIILKVVENKDYVYKDKIESVKGEKWGKKRVRKVRGK